MNVEEEEDENYKLWKEEFETPEILDLSEVAGNEDLDDSLDKAASIQPSSESTSLLSSVNIEEKESICDSISWNDILEEASTADRRCPPDAVSEALRLISASRRRQRLESHSQETFINLSPRQRQDAVSCLRLSFSSSEEVEMRFCPAHSLVLRAFYYATLSLGTSCASDVLASACNLITESITGHIKVKVQISSPLLSFITESVTRVAIASVRLGTADGIQDNFQYSPLPGISLEHLGQFRDFSVRLEKLEWVVDCIQKASYSAHAFGPGGLCQSQECTESRMGLLFPRGDEIGSPPLDLADILCKVPAVSVFNPTAGGSCGTPFCFSFFGPASLSLAQCILSHVQQIRKDAATILAYHTEHVRDSEVYGSRSTTDPRVTLLSIQRWMRKYKPLLCLLERLVCVFSAESTAKHLFRPIQAWSGNHGSRDDSHLFSSLSLNIAALSNAQRWHALRAIEAVCRELDYSALVSSRLMSMRDDDDTLGLSRQRLKPSPPLVLSLDSFPEPAPLSATAMGILMRTIKSYLDEIERFASGNQGPAASVSVSHSLTHSQRELPVAGRAEGRAAITSTELIISDCLRQVADASAAASHDGSSSSNDVSNNGKRNRRIFDLSSLILRAEQSAMHEYSSAIDNRSNSGERWIFMYDYAPSFLYVESKTRSMASTNALTELVQLRENLALLKVIGGSRVGKVDADKNPLDMNNMEQTDSESIMTTTLRKLRFRPLAAMFESAIGLGLASCKYKHGDVANDNTNQRAAHNEVAHNEVTLIHPQITSVEEPQEQIVPPPPPPSVVTTLSVAPPPPPPPPHPPSSPLSSLHIQPNESRSIIQPISRPLSTSSSGVPVTVVRAKPMPGVGYTPLQGTRSSWWDIDAQVEVQKEQQVKDGETPPSLLIASQHIEAVGIAFEAILETSREEDEDDDEDSENDVERIDDKDDEKILSMLEPRTSEESCDDKSQFKEEKETNVKPSAPSILEIAEAKILSPPGGSPLDVQDIDESVSLEAAWARINLGTSQSEQSKWSLLTTLLTTENDAFICAADKVESSQSVRSAIDSLFVKGSDFALEPASAQLERSAGMLILARSARVSGELSKALFDPLRGAALQQLWSMRAICLISESFTMQPFLEKLFSSLMSSSVAGAQARSSSHLTLWLRQAIAQQYAARPTLSASKRPIRWEAPPEHEKIHSIDSSLFSVSVGAFSADSADEMISKGGIQLTYALESNSSTRKGDEREALLAVSRLLFDNVNMEVYNASFSALLRLKRLLWTLNLLSESCSETERALHEASEAATDLGRSYLMERNEQMQRKKSVADRAAAEASVELLRSMPRVHAQRRATLHFISTLYNHTVLNAVLHPWKTLVSRLQTDPSLPSVRAAHSLYLQAVANACHAHHAISDVASLTAAAALSKLLTRVDAFASLCVDFCNVALAIAHGRSSSRSTAMRLLGAIETSAASLPRQIALCTHAAASLSSTGSGGDEASFLSSLTASLDANRFYEKMLLKK